MKNIPVTLVWFDQRDGKGIVEDAKGNEFYIDSSVLKFEPNLLSTHEGRGVSRYGLPLLIDKNLDIKDCNCGKNVRLGGF